MMNKAKILSTVSFLCYTNRSVNLPFEMYVVHISQCTLLHMAFGSVYLHTVCVCIY